MNLPFLLQRTGIAWQHKSIAVNKLGVALALMLICACCRGTTPCAAAGTFYVDAGAGNDANDGASPIQAWQSLKKINETPLKPGDTVLFKRGENWRGSLIPQSGKEGEPIAYGAYGQGVKPLLLGSADRSRASDWHAEGKNIWATAKLSFTELASLNKLEAMPWSVYSEGGAKVKAAIGSGKNAPAEVDIECGASGSASNHIQLFNREIKVREGDYYLFSFRARCTKPFALPAPRLSKQGPPYAPYGIAAVFDGKVGTEWAEYQVRFRSLVSADDGRMTFGLGSVLPAGAAVDFQPLAWRRMQSNDAEVLTVDVGNIIFDHGKAVGVKKWKLEDLQHPGDYYYSAQTGQVMLHAEKNPAESFKSIELALNRHIINESHKSYVTYENLALKYGAAHGIGGDSTDHITVRQCDIAWIGGAHQLTMPDGRPVRFGNGIEFWSNAHDNLVEGCRIWEIYDAALTNQGDNKNTQANITYRNNVIWNSEYSFEYWNGKRSAKDAEQFSKTRNIHFEYNTCVNAGHGWGHAQRPDQNGRHLMFYNNPVESTEFFVRNNIFCNATDSDVRFCNDWTAGLSMDHNCWFQPQGALILFLKTPWMPSQFGDYQAQTRLDAHSIVADPKFVNADAQDFRLASDSAAAKLSTEGGPVGAQQRLVD